MVANLPPQYHEKEAALKKARTPEERIAILEELLSIMPKHKSSEKLQAELKTKIARLRREKEKPSQTARRAPVPGVVREGCGQAVLCGPANAGKSTLLRALTNATPAVADYPFTTKLPLPGMLRYEEVKIQLVDTPSLSLEFSETWMGEILRHADLLVFLFDLSSDNLLEDIEESMKVMERFRIKREQEFSFEKEILWVGNKVDRPESGQIREIFREFYGDKIACCLEISALEGLGLDALPGELFRALRIIRVFTKAPGKPPERESPYTLARNSTVIDLAAAIHRDLVDRFRYARHWREGNDTVSVVGREFVLEDRDVVEIHTV